MSAGPPRSAWREQTQTAFDIATRRLLDHAEGIRRGEGPVVGLKPSPEIREQLELDRYIRDGGLADERLDAFLEQYLASSTRLQHPRYLAHQVASVEPITGVADLIHGVINNPMAIYEMGPAAATVEATVLDWLLSKVGFDQGVGVLTHGGSLANLTALLAARAAAAPDAWGRGVPTDLAVLAPHVSHYSIARAVAIMGLGEDSIVHLDVDPLERVIPERVAQTIERTRAEGRRVMAVTANACATSTGLHDPIDAIGAVCREYGVWFHVDAAHGASALLSETEKHWLDGVELADSVIWDAHKMLRTSALCAAVLFKHPGRFGQAFHQTGDYLFYGDDQEVDAIEPDLISRTIETTKAELGLKLFMSLAVDGEAALADYVSSRYAATRRFYEIIGDRPGFDCPYEPEANILCFRFEGEQAMSPEDGDALQIRIRERLLRSGSYYLTSTTVGPRRYLRMSVMSPLTDEQTIEGMLDAVEETAASLSDDA